MKTVLRLGRNWPILPNISTTTEPVFTNISALVEVNFDVCKNLPKLIGYHSNVP